MDTPPVLVLSARVPEHAQALSLAALALGLAYVTGLAPLPASVQAWTHSSALGYGWAVLFGVSGVPVLVAAWARRTWVRPLRRIALERGGHYMQAGACLYYAAGATSLGARGALGTVAFGAWALAGIVRATRAGRDARAIARVATGG